jgi:hypothetical protein
MRKEDGMFVIDCTTFCTNRETDGDPLQDLLETLVRYGGEFYGSIAFNLYADDWRFTTPGINGKLHYIVEVASEDLLDVIKRLIRE